MIVVTGMHRSGTSLLALWLDAAGVPFGPRSEFYAADAHNPRGYLEERGIIDLNSYIATGFTRTGGMVQRLVGQATYLAGAGDRHRANRVARVHEQMRATAEQRSGVAVKDPRFCLTLGDWDAIDGAVERCVVAVRHPALVVDSLHRRQRIPTRLGYQFWLRHAAGITSGATKKNRLFLDLDALMTGDSIEASAERLADHLAGRADVSALVDAFADVFAPSLVRSQPSSTMPPDVEALYGWMKVLCDSDDL